MVKKLCMTISSIGILLICAAHPVPAEESGYVAGLPECSLNSAEACPSERVSLPASAAYDMWERIRAGLMRSGFSFAYGRPALLVGGPFYKVIHFCPSQSGGTSYVESRFGYGVDDLPAPGLTANCFLIGLKYSFKSFTMKDFYKSVSAFARSVPETARLNPSTVSFYFEIPDF